MTECVVGVYFLTDKLIIIFGLGTSFCVTRNIGEIEPVGNFESHRNASKLELKSANKQLNQETGNLHTPHHLDTSFEHTLS